MTPTFNWKSDFFICSEPCNPKRRNEWSMVRSSIDSKSQNLYTCILEAAKQKQDKEIITRLQGVPNGDLVAVEARYHRTKNCIPKYTDLRRVAVTVKQAKLSDSYLAAAYLLKNEFQNSLINEKQVVHLNSLNGNGFLNWLLLKGSRIQYLNQYYNSYILPILDYGCLVLGHCTVTHCTRILKLQRRAARIVLQADILTPSEFMFRELNWLPFFKRVNYHKCVLMYKSLKNIAPDYLTERFMKVSETHNRQLRSADNDLLKVPYSRTKYYDNSFTVSGAKLWNSLPLNIRQSPSIDSFKCRIKAHLLETNS